MANPRLGARLGLSNGKNVRVKRHVTTPYGHRKVLLSNGEQVFADDARLDGPAWKKTSKVWVCVYEVTRHYGGPEEGGWWYNWYEPVTAIRVPRRFSMAHRDRLQARWNKEADGNIYSVLGGTEYIVRRSNAKFQHATTCRPHYE